MVSGFLLLGTGPSSGIPQLQHVMTMPECEVCNLAVRPTPNMERRDNICSMILYERPDKPGTHARLLFDIGKTFRSSAIRWFRKFHIDSIDAVALTHGHADAVGGFDDIRDIQGAFQTTMNEQGIMTYAPAQRLSVYLTKTTMDYISKCFEYIVSASRDNSNLNARRVGVVDFQIFEETVGTPLRFKPDNPLHGLSVRTFPLYHGGTYICSGFVIGTGKNALVYLSDVSEVPEQSMAFLDSLVPFKILVIDALAAKRPHFSHLCIEECLDFVKHWCPEETYIVGYSCRISRERKNEELRNKIVPSIRAGCHENCIKFEGGETVTDRPFRTREQYFSVSPPLRDLENIRIVQLGHDGLFIPCEFGEQEVA